MMAKVMKELEKSWRKMIKDEDIIGRKYKRSVAEENQWSNNILDYKRNTGLNNDQGRM